jgi:2-polyprenyl-3-methyl-5-hydroxy-6-metoxy-1,4-benzoquinol methylase
MTSRDRWDRIASTAPYFAVLAEPRFVDPTAEALAAFHRSGDACVERLIRELDVRVLLSAGRIRTVLEFGSGPGRLAAAYARRGFAVTAADISPAMLALTRQNAPAVDVQLDTDLFTSRRRFDLVSCVFVLQHLDDRDALDVVRRLIACVAPGGFLHIQFPFRTHRPFASRAMLDIRQRVPALNRLANASRGRRSDLPLLVPRMHSIDAIVSELAAHGLSVLQLDVTRENELEMARIIAARDAGALTAEDLDLESRSPEAPTPERKPDFVDVNELMRATSLDEWNRRAEQYFAGLTSVDSQLAKPFSSPNDAPAILIAAGVVLQAARLLPGMTVVDFGAGTGWLTRSLAQLGCRVISVDVSASALDISRRDLEARPLAGTHPSPSFLRFDGRKLALDDASVDRIICFDAFHHVPNPEDVLREFARILKPGGLAAFSEPGPRHSHSAQSQFEMRTYGVLENDVDLHALWPIARAAGFAEIRVGVFNADPRLIELPAYDQLLRGGAALVEAARHLRDFLLNARTFTLRKPGNEALDSRTASALGAGIDVTLRSEPHADAPIAVRATVRNTGSADWLPSPINPGGVCLGVHLYAGNELVTFDHYWEPFPNGLPAGEAAELEFQLPPLAPGAYVLEFDCVAQNVAWFATNGSATKRLALDIRR